jgi:hypothetical protein
VSTDTFVVAVLFIVLQGGMVIRKNMLEKTSIARAEYESLICLNYTLLALPAVWVSVIAYECFFDLTDVDMTDELARTFDTSVPGTRRIHVEGGNGECHMLSTMWCILVALGLGAGSPSYIFSTVKNATEHWPTQREERINCDDSPLLFYFANYNDRWLCFESHLVTRKMALALTIAFTRHDTLTQTAVFVAVNSMWAIFVIIAKPHVERKTNMCAGRGQSSLTLQPPLTSPLTPPLTLLPQVL